MSTLPEPKVLRDVREACRIRHSFLHSLYNGSVTGSVLPGGDDLSSLSNKQWISKSEKIWSSYPPGHVLSSLEHLALDTIRVLRQQQSSSVPAEHVETSGSVSGNAYEMRDYLEASGHARSESGAVRHDSLGYLPSFRTLINEGWALSVMMSSQLRHLQRETQRLSEHLVVKMQEIHRSLEEGGGNYSIYIRALFDMELRLVRLRGCRETLQLECQKLQAEAAENREGEKHLQIQQHSVEDYCRLLDNKQTQIQVLLKGISTTKSQIQQSNEEVRSYVVETLLPRPQELIQETHRLQDSAKKDAQHFNRISLLSLKKVSIDGGDRLPVQDLSINRLSDPLSPHYAIYKGIYASMGLPLYKAPETFLPHVADMKKQLFLLRNQLYSRNLTIARIEQQYCFTQGPDTDTLLQLLSTHYATQTNQLFPTLQRLIQQCEQSKAYGKEVQASVSDWWEQPAQLCLPWEERGGLTLRQWRDRWTVAVTALQRASGGRS